MAEPTPAPQTFRISKTKGQASVITHLSGAGINPEITKVRLVDDPTGEAAYFEVYIASLPDATTPLSISLLSDNLFDDNWTLLGQKTAGAIPGGGDSLEYELLKTYDGKTNIPKIFGLISTDDLDVGDQEAFNVMENGDAHVYGDFYIGGVKVDPAAGSGITDVDPILIIKDSDSDSTVSFGVGLTGIVRWDDLNDVIVANLGFDEATTNDFVIENLLGNIVLGSETVVENKVWSAESNPTYYLLDTSAAAVDATNSTGMIKFKFGLDVDNTTTYAQLGYNSATDTVFEITNNQGLILLNGEGNELEISANEIIYRDGDPKFVLKDDDTSDVFNATPIYSTQELNFRDSVDAEVGIVGYEGSAVLKVTNRIAIGGSVAIRANNTSSNELLIATDLQFGGDSVHHEGSFPTNNILDNTTITDGYVLTWDDTNNYWYAAAGGGGGATLGANTFTGEQTINMANPSLHLKDTVGNGYRMECDTAQLDIDELDSSGTYISTPFRIDTGALRLNLQSTNMEWNGNIVWNASNLANVSQASAEAGTSTTFRSWSPQRVKQAIDALAPGGGNTAFTNVANIFTEDQEIKTTSPALFLNETDATDNNWLFTVSAGVFNVERRTDANVYVSTPLRISLAAKRLELTSTTLIWDGNAVATGSGFAKTNVGNTFTVDQTISTSSPKLTLTNTGSTGGFIDSSGDLVRVRNEGSGTGTSMVQLIPGNSSSFAFQVGSDLTYRGGEVWHSLSTVISQADAEAGTATGCDGWSSLRVAQAATAIHTSARRLKTIKGVEYDLLDLVCKIGKLGSTLYTLNSDPKKELRRGFVLEDIKDLMKGVTGVDDKGEDKYLFYTSMVSPLYVAFSQEVKLRKKLEVEIDKLKLAIFGANK